MSKDKKINTPKYPSQDIRQKQVVKAIRLPIHGHGVDWIIDEDSDIFLGCIKTGIQTDIYPYNKIFDVKVFV